MGALERLQNGKFGHGFIAAGFAKGIGTPIYDITGSNATAGFVATIVIGGTTSEISGGKFANGARTTAFLTAVQMVKLPTLYKKFVGYDLDIGPGGAAVSKGEVERPHEGANNIGTQHAKLDPNCIFCEGGWVSRILNHIPGVNAAAGVHDVMQVSLGTGLARDILNVPGMFVAAPFTYAAAFSQPLMHLGAGEVIGIATIHSRDKELNRGR